MVARTFARLFPTSVVERKISGFLKYFSAEIAGRIFFRIQISNLNGFVVINAVSDPAKSGDNTAGETIQVPEDLDSDQINSFLATLSDAQVRRLLIQELKKEASRELTEGETQEETGGLAGLI